MDAAGADAARVIATRALGRDPGPLTAVSSASHGVYVGAEVVLKVIDAAGHRRLDREITLVPRLPAGIAPPLLASGRFRLEPGEVRYACYTRAPGAAPGMSLPGIDGGTARVLAEQAVARLGALHQWEPAGDAERTLREPPDHGGFTSQAALAAQVEQLAAANRDAAVPSRLLDGLRGIAGRAPRQALAAVPVHADCHWGNWLVRGQEVTALLDFEWARFGEPADDWHFLARFSGPHAQTVLDVIARATATPLELLRAQCEVRDAAHLTSDLRTALGHPGAAAGLVADRLVGLAELVTGRYWWRDGRP